MVQTVLGPVAGSALGATLMHEHIIMIDPAMTLAFPDWLDMDRFAQVVGPQLKRLYELGIRTIIDATPINLGRDVRVIEAMSRLSGIHMIACTGLYHYENPWVCNPDPEWTAEMYIREITQGIQGTSIRAGAIKCATDENGVTDWNRAMLQAAAMASVKCDVPILSHTCVEKKNGIDQMKVLLDAGASPKRVVIGHSGDSNDIGYLKELLASGCWLGMDRFGLEQFNPMDRRIDTLAKLIGMGYAGQLLLSHDSNFYSDPWRPWHAERYAPQTAGHNMRMISEIVLPRLREMGIGQDVIDMMMQDNVQRLFEG